MALVAPRQETTSSTVTTTGSSTSDSTASTSLTTQSSGSSATGTPTLTTTASTTSDTPFFPDPSSLHPPSNNESDRKSELSKAVLEWVFVVLAIIIIGTLILRRLNQLKLQNRPLSDFFRSRRSSNNNSILNPASRYSSTTERRQDHHIRTSYPRIQPTAYGAYNLTPYDLANVPSAFQLSQLTGSHLGSNHPNIPHAARGRTTRAQNIDESGRRLDSDADSIYGSRGDKDVLPAYDKYGGPPGYVEVSVEQVGGSGAPTFTLGRLGPLGLVRGQGDGQQSPSTETGHETEESRQNATTSTATPSVPSSTAVATPNTTVIGASHEADTRTSDNTSPS